MTLFIQNDATGAGAGNLDPNQAAVDLAIIANGDTGLGLAAQVGNSQQVTYARTDPGIPPTRLDNLVNSNFAPDYGGGPQNVDIVILPVLANFTLNDGTSILIVGGVALPPQGSGLGGAGLNNTYACLVIYDTTQNNAAGYCAARAGTGGTLNLASPNPVILHHELSHASRIVTNTMLAVTAACNPSSPEENAAITDENHLRTQIANAAGSTPVLRDPGIHCGAICGGVGFITDPDPIPCCIFGAIIATAASGSPLSEEVSALRSIRDSVVRKSEVGFAFFQSLFHAYYGFSPQVCVLMASHGSLRPLILEGFVRPLVCILQIIEDYALGHDDALALGQRFARQHLDPDAARERLAFLNRARRVIEGGHVELTDAEKQLAQLLFARALQSEHVTWALVEPIGIYQSALLSYLEGNSHEQIGTQLYEAINSWVPRAPLDAVWASLSQAELGEELANLKRTLFRSPEARATLLHRLKVKFAGASTAIATSVSDEAFRLGGNE